jgi:hypothetical protein
MIYEISMKMASTPRGGVVVVWMSRDDDDDVDTDRPLREDNVRPSYRWVTNSKRFDCRSQRFVRLIPTQSSS